MSHPALALSWRHLAAAVAALIILHLAPAARAQDAQEAAWQPQRPITLLVPFGAGGIADVTARSVAEAMGQELGQSVVVDNRPSAGSIVATQAAAKAKPDGHTLLLMSNGHAVSANLFKKRIHYDTTGDFQAISTLGFFDLGIFTAPQSPWANLAQFLAATRANPGQRSIGTIAAGSTQHLATVLFQNTAGLDVLVVPYKTSPALQAALMGGEVDAAIEVLGPMLGHVKGGSVRALAVTGAERNAALPDVPTVEESGVKGYAVASWNSIAAPAGTPADVVARLGQAVSAALLDPGVQQRLGGIGMRLEASTPEAAHGLLASEIERWGAVIRANNIALE